MNYILFTKEYSDSKESETQGKIREKTKLLVNLINFWFQFIMIRQYFRSKKFIVIFILEENQAFLTMCYAHIRHVLCFMSIFLHYYHY